MSFEYIKQAYNIPAKRGGRVEYTGGKEPKKGTIVGASGAHLKIVLDGEEKPGIYHPAWELHYL